MEFCGAKKDGVLTLFATFVDGTPVEGWQNVMDLEVENEGDESTRSYLGLHTVNPGDTAPEWVERAGPGGIPFARVDVPTNDSSKVWAAPSRNLIGASIYKAAVSGGTWTWTRTLETDWGGDNLGVSTGYQGDGGILSWQWSNPTLSIDVSDSDPDRVVVTGDFPYVTDDGGQSWMQMYVNPETENPADSEITLPKTYHHGGLGVTTGHWLHWVSPDLLLGASTDIGLQRSADGGVTWTTDYTPVDVEGGLDTANWYSIARQPGTARIYAAVASINDFYEPGRLKSDSDDNETGDIRYSDDYGQNWTSIGSGISNTLDGKFPGPVINVTVDPGNPSHIYAASASSKMDGMVYLGGIYRSTNGGSSWSKLTNPPDTEGRPLSIHVIGTNELVVTFCARQDGSGDHTESSGVFYSDDGGTTWSPRMTTNMAYYTRDLVVDPGNSSRWFVAVQSTKTDTNHANPVYDGRGGVYRTNNKGNDWVRIFTHDGVQSATYIPGTTPLLYVTSLNEGLWVSSNPNDTTPSFTRVTSFPFARARRVFVDPHRIDGTIWVTTQGGGLWRGTVVPTMAAAVVRNGVTFDFQIDVTDSGGSAPDLYGITDLASSPGGWSVLTGITPSTSSPAAGVTRYTWASVSGHSLFSGLNGGFARAVRTRSDGTEEVGEAGGWVTEELQTGHIESWGVPWLKPHLHRTPAVSLGSTVELSVPYTGGFASGKQYYVEIEEGNAKGHRFEIIESSSTTTSWVIDTSSAFNTSSTLPALNGARVSLREHWTFDEVFPRSQFSGGTGPTVSDEIIFWETHGGISDFYAYWHFKVGSTSKWVKSGDGALANQGSRLILPGEGAFMRARPSTANRVAPGWGMVRQQLFRHPIKIGPQLTSLGFPVSMSCGSNHQLASDGFLATLSPTTADRVHQWNGDTTPGSSGYTIHWYMNVSGKKWILDGGGLIDKTWDLIFKKQRAFLIEAKSTAKPDRVVSLPWTP